MPGLPVSRRRRLIARAWILVFRAITRTCGTCRVTVEASQGFRGGPIAFSARLASRLGPSALEVCHIPIATGAWRA